MDNLFLTAIIYQFGSQIEARRVPTREQRVFSYRFAPQRDFGLYDPAISWLEFWARCQQKIASYQYAVYLDIADYYNQIYHHVVENQLLEAGVQNQIKKWIMDLLEKVTAKMSRGIPVGPHATHLLGEMSMIPIDNSMSLKGLDFCRYADDIVIFCNNRTDASIIIYQLAEILDKQQRLMLQQQKTKIFEAPKFFIHCNAMIKDRPINKYEREILKVIRHRSTNPYSAIDIRTLTNEELKLFSKELVENILSEYLGEKDPNYARLRWFLRRLSQVGVPSAVEYCISHVDRLMPAISDICHYLIAVGNNYSGDWREIGGSIFNLLDSNIIKSNEYFQISLLSLFSRNPSLNHVNHLISLYQNATSNMRREILLSAFKLGLGDWIRELKEEFSGLDPWSKRAFIVATKSLPLEERRFFLKYIKDGNILSELLIKWAMI